MEQCVEVKYIYVNYFTISVLSHQNATLSTHSPTGTDHAFGLFGLSFWISDYWASFLPSIPHPFFLLRQS